MTLEFDGIPLDTDADGKEGVGVNYKGESFWLCQMKVAVLFGVGVPVINEHLLNSLKSKDN